jgi:hypothetical protein
MTVIQYDVIEIRPSSLKIYTFLNPPPLSRKAPTATVNMDTT